MPTDHASAHTSAHASALVCARTQARAHKRAHTKGTPTRARTHADVRAEPLGEVCVERLLAEPAVAPASDDRVTRHTDTWRTTCNRTSLNKPPMQHRTWLATMQRRPHADQHAACVTQRAARQRATPAAEATHPVGGLRGLTAAPHSPRGGHAQSRRSLAPRVTPRATPRVPARGRVVRGTWLAAARHAACGMHGWLLRTTGARGRGASPRCYAEVRAVAQEPRHGEADLRTATTRGMRRRADGNVRHCGAIAARWEGDEEGNQRAWAARQCGMHAVAVRRSGGTASSAPKGCCRSAGTRRVVATARAGLSSVCALVGPGCGLGWISSPVCSPLRVLDCVLRFVCVLV